MALPEYAHSLGGKARMKQLTKAQRRDFARQGLTERWNRYRALKALKAGQGPQQLNLVLTPKATAARKTKRTAQ